MGFCDLPGADLLCGTVTGGVTDSVTTSIGNWIASSLGDLAVSAVNMAAQAINNTTVVDLNASWFRDNYAMLLPIGLTVLVATFCMQLARAAIRRDGQALTQAVTGTITGVLFSMCAFMFTSVALTVVDALSAGLFSMVGTSMSDAVRRIIKVSMITTAGGLGWTIAAVAALACAAGAVLYWGLLIFRKVSILILVTLAIFAGAGGGWEHAARWRKSWIETTGTLVASKLIMTVIFILGVSAIGNSDTKDGVTALSDIVAGLVVMLLVLLCPMALYKFMHWAGDSGAHELHRTASTGLSTASAATKKAAQMAAAKGAAAKGGAAAPQGPSNLAGSGSPQAGAPEGGSGEGGSMPTSFRFPGTSGTEEGGSGGKQVGNQPLIRRPGQGPDAMSPQADSAPGGDEGTALFQRGPSTAAASAGSTAAPPSGSPSARTPSAGTAPSAGAPAAGPGSNPAPAGRPASPQAAIPSVSGPQAESTRPGSASSAPAPSAPSVTANPSAAGPPTL